jgi:acyl carrier protein
MTHEEIVETVKEFILTQFLPGEDRSALTPSTPLITGGILDSLATLEVVSFLEQRYSIELQAHEVDPARIGTLDGIADLVEAKTAGK